MVAIEKIGLPSGGPLAGWLVNTINVAAAFRQAPRQLV